MWIHVLMIKDLSESRVSARDTYDRFKKQHKLMRQPSASELSNQKTLAGREDDRISMDIECMQQ